MPADNIEEKAKELLRTKGKLEAIKYVKEELGIGLKEAKDLVEELVAKDPILNAKGPKAPSQVASGIIAAVLLILLVAGCKSCFCSGDKSTVVATPQTREDSIKVGFSSWNGSHKALVEVVKASLNDANSFEHLDTKYWDKKTHLVVKMEYTAKNAMGGRVKGHAAAKCNVDGTVIELMQVE